MKVLEDLNMRNLWTIIKKELRRFFTDKRMLISLLLPGIMIYVLYNVMGDVMKITSVWVKIIPTPSW